MVEETKVCRTCGIEKSVSEFPRRIREKYVYIEPHCKCCDSITEKKQKQKRIQNISLLCISDIEKKFPSIKKCVKCECEKPISEFGWGNKKLAYKSPYCKVCENDISKKNYIKYRKRAMWRNAKSRAEKKHLVFDITIDDIVIPEVCPVFGGIMTTDGSCDRNTSPSLDRIDPCKGYVRGNIMVISNRANQIKNDANVVELEKIIKYIKENTQVISCDYSI